MEKIKIKGKIKNEINITKKKKKTNKVMVDKKRVV